MKKKLTVLLLSIFYFTQLWGQEPLPAFEFTDCFLEDCAPFAKDATMQYAYLTVPEDYNQPEGRKLRLAVMIIKSQSEDPLPDPIIYLRGGPGYKVFLNDLINVFRNHPLRQNRDIILMDFRGIGLSEPTFSPELQKDLMNLFLLNLTPDESRERYTGLLERCFENLSSEGINLNMYNTAMVVKDLEMLRKALEIEQWNLWGISYGTRVAQTYMRDFPQAVRCTIMDSPVPLGYPAAGEEVVLYRSSLNKFFAACRENPGCNKAFPELESRFYITMELLKNNPLIISNQNAPEGIAVLNFQDVQLIVQQLLYNPGFYPILPWLIKAIEERNSGIFENLLLQMAPNFFIYSEAMYVLVLKYDTGQLLNDYRTSPDNPLYNALNHYENRDYMLRRMDYIRQDPLEILPVVSDIPSLILVGSIDPVTPPAYAHILKKSLTQSFLFEFQGRGHGVTRNTDCAKSIAFDFVNEPWTLPGNDCIAAMEAHSIPWVTKIYQNAHIANLANQLLIQKQWIHVAGVILLLISFLVSAGIALVNLFHKTSLSQLRTRNIITSLATLFAVAFLTGIVWFIIKTVNNHEPLLLIGLLSDAAPIFYFSPIVLATTLISSFWYIRTLKHASTGGKIIYGIMNISLLWVCVLIFQFQLFPNL